MRLLSGALIAGILAWAAPASAQLQPSPLGDIYASYNDCFKVAAKDGINQAVLASLGWSRAEVSRDGKPVADAPPIYGHAERAPIIVLSKESGPGLCIVSARLESASAFEEFKKAWGGKLPPPDAEGNITFFADGHPVLLKRTGTTETPSLTISVMTPVEKE